MSQKSIAIQAAQIASAIIKKKFGHSVAISAKGNNPRDLVTEVDITAERSIIKVLKKAYPTYGIIAEESGINKNKSKSVWVIDPLDGTMNFTRGIPCFSVSIALVENKRVVLGVVTNPLTNELYWAENGRGAFLNNKPITVSRTYDFRDAFISAEWWSRTPGYRQRGINIFMKLALTNTKLRYISGTAWALTRVASGRFDVETCDTTFLDIAAATLIVQEAGGIVTDDRGQKIIPFDMSIKRIVATNPYLHTKILKLING